MMSKDEASDLRSLIDRFVKTHLDLATANLALAKADRDLQNFIDRQVNDKK